MDQLLAGSRNAVPAKVFSAWKEKKSRGDVAKLMAFTGLSKPVIIKALKHGQAKPELVLKISRYYSKKPLQTAEHLEEKAMAILNPSL